MTQVMRGDSGHVEGAAQVWAEATAARDGDPQVAPLELSRPLIAEVFALPGAMLTVALAEEGQVAAFALAAPPATDRAELSAGLTGMSVAEVRYVGVRPSYWGRGLASRVLRLLCAELSAAGFTEAELKVYVDNTRAARVYQKLGWEPYGCAAPHPRTGKPDQRYRLRLSATEPGGG